MVTVRVSGLLRRDAEAFRGFRHARHTPTANELPGLGMVEGCLCCDVGFSYMIVNPRVPILQSKLPKPLNPPLLHRSSNG